MSEVDEKGMKELRVVQERIGEVWREGTHEVLEQRNPALLKELDQVEKVMNSLLLIPKKHTPLKKQWREALLQYETIGMNCVEYANRHLPEEV